MPCMVSSWMLCRPRAATDCTGCWTAMKVADLHVWVVLCSPCPEPTPHPLMASIFCIQTSCSCASVHTARLQTQPWPCFHTGGWVKCCWINRCCLHSSSRVPWEQLVLCLSQCTDWRPAGTKDSLHFSLPGLPPFHKSVWWLLLAHGKPGKETTYNSPACNSELDWQKKYFAVS